MALLIQTRKQKQLLTKVELMMYLKQCILQLYQIYKMFQEKLQAALLIQSFVIILYFKVYSLRWRQLLKLLKELVHQKIELTNIQNVDDNECFKWCLVRYLHPADHKPRRITKANRNFAKKIDFKDIKFPVKLEICKKLKKKKKFYWHQCF